MRRFIAPLVGSVALAWWPCPANAQPEAGTTPDLVPVLSDVRADRLRSTVDRLAAFGTRHSLSSASDPDRGIGVAARWLEQEFRDAGPRLEVSIERWRQEPTPRLPDGAELFNVVAVLPGTQPAASNRRYYVLGHYDSRASDPMDATSDAPGANDDASGVAVVLELARVLANRQLDATVVFAATTGEEQGLLGARRLAQTARESGWHVAGVLSNDIVGDPTGRSGPEGRIVEDRTHVRVFSEGLPSNPDARSLTMIRSLGAESDLPSRQLARYVADVARREGTDVQPVLIFRPDRFLRGGDHSAFNEAGFPAVRFTQVYENYDRQHQDVRTTDGRRFGDEAEHVDADYLAGVARLNLATLVHMASAPGAPANARVIAAELEYGTTLRWEKGPEPDLAGYEVVWRRTTSPDWDQAMDVGKVTEARLPLSKDDWFFGVRAYDTEGFRSPVAFPVAARE